MQYRLTLLILVSLAGCGGGGGTHMGGPPVPSCVSTAIVVCAQSGQVQGTIEGTYRAFRGIPFAAPPVGALQVGLQARHQRSLALFDGESLTRCRTCYWENKA